MIIVFQSTRDVIRAEKYCREEKLPIRIIPVPKHISSECGMAIETNEGERVLEFLNRMGIHARGES